MADSYTSSLRLSQPEVGADNGTWGTILNSGTIALIDDAIAGTVAVTMTDADYTLTNNNGSTDESRRMYLVVSGTLTTTRNVICPGASKLYFIKNSTTGGFAITLKRSSGTGVSIPNGHSMLLFCDGTNVIDPISYFTAFNTASIGATTPGTGTFTNLSYTGTLTGSTGVLNIGSNQVYKDASGNIGLGVVPTAGQGILQVNGAITSLYTINAQVGTTYTFVAADTAKLTTLNNASAITLTIPLNTYSTGTTIDFMQTGAGQVTVVGAGGVTVNGTPGLKTRAQYSAVTAILIAANSWVLVGDLSA
jgi:hypothetical protein